MGDLIVSAEGGVPQVGWQKVVGLWHESGALIDLGQQVHLEVGGEGVGQAHVAREG